MKTHLTFLPAICALATYTHVSAQGVDVSKVVTLLDSTLTATWEMTIPPPYYTSCSNNIFSDYSSVNLTCVGGMDGNPAADPYPVGIDAAGRRYLLSMTNRIDLPFSRFVRLFREDLKGPSMEILWIHRVVCQDDSCRYVYRFGATVPLIDLANGIIGFTGSGYLCDATGNNFGYCSAEAHFKMTIRGLPTLFDTLLTFVPNGQSLTALTPAYPDGFRSEHSLQLWAGDVRTLPDWSQAQPVACMAATNPTPGHLVSVMDTLPDPGVGEGRYYVLASESGVDRRLGRQYVNGAFSAREPTGLPMCQ